MSDRKYRSPGYQDDAREEPRRGPSSAPPPRKEGPRGRGLGAPTESVFRCSQCGNTMPIAFVVELASTCPKCSRDLHACANCRFFDSAARWECRQAITTRILSKVKRNECELFEGKTVQQFAKESEKARDPKDPRAAFDALFK
jgi:hypothetical protein